jgi:hypothetical protein
MKIDATNIDSYYKQLNTIIDNYFALNVSAKALKLHFSKPNNIKRLIEANKLNDVDNISKILSDVINDRYYVEMDSKFKTFENYTESKKDTIFWLTKDGGIYEERALADFLHVSLSAIETVDKKTHKYSVKGKNYLVYTDSDIADFSYAIRKNVTSKIQESIIKYDSLEIEVSNICDNDKLNKIIVEYVSTDVMLNLISKELNVTIHNKTTVKNILILEI